MGPFKLKVIFKPVGEALTAFLKETHVMKREIWKWMFRSVYHYVILLPKIMCKTEIFQNNATHWIKLFSIK